MNIDDIYINFWGKQKPKFTELELAVMEGGHSLESDNEKNTNNTNTNNANRMQFIRSITKPLGR